MNDGVIINKLNNQLFVIATSSSRDFPELKIVPVSF